MKIHIIEKIIVTFLFALAIFGGYMIQETAEFIYPSESFAADKPNKIWYILMHIGMIMGFYFLGSIFGSKKFIYTITAFASLGVLMFNMFTDYNIHAFFTAALFILGSYCAIFYTEKIIKYIAIGLLPVLAIGFILAVINPEILFTVYEIEMQIEIVLGILLLTDLWIFQKYRKQLKTI